ncbi:MAG: hypothetical protein ABI450_04720 [Rhizomicrobium sp.]
MRGKWLWLIYLLAALVFVRAAVSAFSAPWIWTSDQIFFVFLLFSIAVGLGSWIVIWLRGGTAAVKAHWAARQERMQASFTGKSLTRNLWFWLLIAVALVIFFNLAQR